MSSPLSARIWDLHRAAAGGKGFHTLAPQVAGTADWRTVDTVFHEAGHAAVARAHGFAATIEIFSPDNGRCTTSLDHDGAHLVALAGAVAASFAMFGLATPAENLVRGLNESDRAAAGEFTSDDVAEVANMVWADWDSVSAEAGRVLREVEAAWRLQPPAASGTSWIRAEALHWHRQRQAAQPETRNVRAHRRPAASVVMEAPEWYLRGQRKALAMMRGRAGGAVA